MTAYQCNSCGAKAEGSVDDLYRKGWRRRSIKKGNRLKHMTACPLHAELVDKEGSR